MPTSMLGCVTRLPPSVMVPELIGRRPATRLRNVLLPQPDGPHDADELAVFDRKADGGERLDRASLCGLVGLAHSDRFDHGRARDDIVIVNTRLTGVPRLGRGASSASNRTRRSLSKRVAGSDQRAPHMRRWRVVVAEAFLRLFEMTADDVLELIHGDDHIGIEGIEVVHADHPRRHIPFVFLRPLVFGLNISIGPVVRTEPADVVVGIAIADRLVRIEAQALMVTDRPAHLLVDIGLDELRTPIAVIAADEADDRDVMQEARQYHFLFQAVLLGEVGALQEMLLRTAREAELEKIQQHRLLGHLGQARVLAHEELLSGSLAEGQGLLAIGQLEEQRFGDQAVAKLLHLAVLQFIRTFGKGQRFCHGISPSHARAWQYQATRSSVPVESVWRRWTGLTDAMPRLYGSGDGSLRGLNGNTVRALLPHAVAAPATVSGEPSALVPLAKAGKAVQGNDPRARRPAITVVICGRVVRGCATRGSVRRSRVMLYGSVSFRSRVTGVSPIRVRGEHGAEAFSRVAMAALFSIVACRYRIGLGFR